MREINLQHAEVVFVGLGASAQRQMMDYANKTRNHAILAVQTGRKTGKIYRRGKKGKKLHRASAPGEAPATDTGTMAANIIADAIPDGAAAGVPTRPIVRRGAAAGAARRNMRYPAILELKKRRPWLAPATNAAIGGKPLPSGVHLKTTPRR